MIIFVLALFCVSGDDLQERLLIRPLPDGHVMTHLQFDVTTDFISPDNDAGIPGNMQFEYFPKTLGGVLYRSEVEEIHFALTNGRWLDAQWGHGVSQTPRGLELSAVHRSSEDVEEKWEFLIEQLSAVYCSSKYNLKLEMKNPEISVQPIGERFRDGVDYDLFYGTSPLETACTENLNPFKRLHPCRDHAGLGRYLIPKIVLRTDYQALQVHIVPLCKDPSCTQRVWRFTQTFTFVFIPNPDFILQDVFEAQELSACPLASVSSVYVHRPPFLEPYQFKISPENPMEDFNSWSLYEFTKNEPLPTLSFHGVQKFRLPVDNIVHTTRYLTGGSTLEGGISTFIENISDQPLRLTYRETHPSFIKVYYSSVVVEVDGIQLDSPFELDEYEFKVAEEESPSRDNTGQPFKECGYLIFTKTLNPGQNISLSFDFGKRFLHWQHYPPDYNRGFDIPSGILTVQNVVSYPLEWWPHATKRFPSSFRVYTPQLLVQLPYPDMSMVFNVWAFSSTIFSVMFTTLFNILYREPNDQKAENLKMLKEMLYLPLFPIAVLVQRARKQLRQRSHQD